MCNTKQKLTDSASNCEVFFVVFFFTGRLVREGSQEGRNQEEDQQDVLYNSTINIVNESHPFLLSVFGERYWSALNIWEQTTIINTVEPFEIQRGQFSALAKSGGILVLILLLLPMHGVL